MRTSKRAILLCLALLCLPLGVSAAGEPTVIEAVSLTVHADYYREDAQGGELHLYYVGSRDEDGSVSPEGAFRGYASFLSFDFKDSEEARELAHTLDAYVELDGLSADRSALPNGDKHCIFSDLQPGVWLLAKSSCICENKQYVSEPALIVLPTSQQSGEMAESHLKYETSSLANEGETLQVVKIWQTGEHAELRPSEITVVLLENGQEAESVTLREDTGWRYTWTDLNAESVWTVAEYDVPSGYTVRITKEGTTFQIVNTLTAQPSTEGKNTGLPQTGMLIWPIPVSFSAGLLLLAMALIHRIRRQS